jgi:Kef-type K+ transport system membrane component KefB
MSPLDSLNLALVLTTALAAGAVARRFRQPAILGELIAGLVVGPPLLGLLHGGSVINALGEFGIVLLMLYIGVHLRVAELRESSWGAVLAAVGGFVVPAGLGYMLMRWLGVGTVGAMFVALAMGVTALATKSRVLADLGLLRTRVAHVMMAGAMVSDVIALVFFAALLGLEATGGVRFGDGVALALRAVLFLFLAVLVGLRLLPLLGDKIKAARLNDQTTLLLVIIVGLLFGGAAEAAGLHAILGVFLAGLFIDGDMLGRQRFGTVERRLQSLSIGLLAPIFFVSAGFSVQLDVIWREPVLVSLVMVVATLGKIFGTALFYLPSGRGFREGIVIGAGMNGRGAVEIVVAEIALEAGLIDDVLFSVMVLMAIVTTALDPVLLSRAVAWLRSRGELEESERSGVVIVGAGPLATHLATLLAASGPVHLIDASAEQVAKAQAAGVDAVRGDVMDPLTFDPVPIENARAVIAMTPNSEINTLAAQQAVDRYGVPRVLAALSPMHVGGLRAVLEDAGVDLLFGRPVDVRSWGVDLAAGRTSELQIEVTDPDQDLEAGLGTGGQENPSVELLPLVVTSGPLVTLFDGQADLVAGSTVVGLTRPPVASDVIDQIDDPHPQ